MSPLPDAILAVQLTIAWAGEGRFEPRRLGWRDTIDEPGSDEARAGFVKDHADQSAEVRVAEDKRRDRKAAKTDDVSETCPLFDREAADEEGESDT